MPTTDYSKTIIYKIVCENECYVGHTTNFINRKCQHKSNSKIRNTKLYQFIRDKEWTMIPIEEFPCDNKTQACIREDYWINELKPSLNLVGAVLSVEKMKKNKKEYYEDNREIINEQRRQYYKDNKETFAKNSKQYRENNKEKIAEYKKKYGIQNKEIIAEKSKQFRENNKTKLAEKKRIYQSKNKAKLAEYHKNYYSQNKDKYAVKSKQKYECECGAIISLSSKSNHKNTSKHLHLMEAKL